jgi:hypothetical protein
MRELVVTVGRDKLPVIVVIVAVAVDTTVAIAVGERRLVLQGADRCGRRRWRVTAYATRFAWDSQRGEVITLDLVLWAWDGWRGGTRRQKSQCQTQPEGRISAEVGTQTRTRYKINDAPHTLLVAANIDCCDRAAAAAAAAADSAAAASAAAVAAASSVSRPKRPSRIWRNMLSITHTLQYGTTSIYKSERGTQERVKKLATRLITCCNARGAATPWRQP